ncbi:MAG: hypothetical protein M1817_000165 [Caeruleum heppii]|nr:MAG: hypothetical protein M1817_000165 [Caeruleum heppii]
MVERETTADNKSAPDVDFSTAPSDPTELALWVAKQISSFGDEGGLYGHRYDDGDDPVLEAERERTKEENRERKKRWRESNAERNKDNDLRCRINKRAKVIWGSTQSPQRTAWMEQEFNKRRAKRETKEKFRSLDDGFGGFRLSPGFGTSLFPTPGVGPRGETNAAGLLLANALLGVGSNDAGPNAEAANALKAALEGGSVDPRPFTEALRAMAANPEIMNGINAILGGYSGNDDLSGDEDMNGIVPTTEPHEAIAGSHAGSFQRPLADYDEQSEIVKRINQATAMLNQLPDANDTSPTPTGLNHGNSLGVEGEVVAGTSEANAAAGGHGLDQAQIDALLTLANGGNLPQAQASESQSVPLAGDSSARQSPSDGSQPDNDMSAILQRIIQQVMAQKEDDGANETPAAETVEHVAVPAGPSPSAHLDPFGVAKNPAMALTSLLHCAGMSINTVIPTAQGHATSQLYARLSNHSRSSTPLGGGINPAHASAFGSTVTMNQRLLARPNAYSRPLHTQNTTLGKGGNFGPPPSSRPRNSAEEKKARSFGFPPLPGTKISIPRRG